MAQALLTGGVAKVVGSDVDVGALVKTGAVVGSFGAAAGAVQGYQEGEAVWGRVTVLQLRQELCCCPDPDGPRKPVVASTP